MIIFFSHYKKMNKETTYYKKNREAILNIAKEYYEKTKKYWKNKQEINTENYLKKKKE